MAAAPQSSKEGRTSVSYDKDCYVGRSFRKQTFTIELLKADFKFTLVVVTNATKQELVSLGIDPRKIGLWKNGRCDDQDEWTVLIPEDHEQLSDEELLSIRYSFNGRKALHLFQLSNEVLIPLRTNGTISEILKFIRSGETEEYLNDLAFTEQYMSPSPQSSKSELWGENKAVIIADEPGMGKSFLLAKAAYRMKEFMKKENRKTWVSRVDLNRFSMIYGSSFCLEAIKVGEYDPGKSVDYLYEMVKSGHSQLELNILKHLCSKHSKVVILFDGFDEICPSYKDEVMHLLKSLKTSNRVKIWVTTRLHEKHTLEEGLDSLAYTISPFTQEDQADFLNSFWKKCLFTLEQNNEKDKIMKKLENICSKSEIKEIRQIYDKRSIQSESTFWEKLNIRENSKILLNQLNYSTKDMDLFTGNPLHMFMLGTVLFEKNFSDIKELGLGNMYEMFIEIKANIFNQQKCLSCGNPSAELQASFFKEKIREIHQQLSASRFFKEDITHKLREPSFKEVIKKVGLVTCKSSSFQFIHKTFGEYFFAAWLINNAKRKDVSQFIFEKVFVEDIFSSVRKFVDSQNMIKSNNIRFFLCDVTRTRFFERKIKAGTSLHRLAKEGLAYCLDLIFVNFENEVLDIILEEDERKRNILHLACLCDHGQAVTLILRFNSGSSKKLLLHVDDTGSLPLNLACGNRCIVEIVDYLRDDEVDKDTKRKIFLSETHESIWYSCFRSSNEKTLEQVTALADEILTASELRNSFSKESSHVFKFSDLFKQVDLNGLEGMWRYVSSKLDRTSQADFMMMETYDETRFLSNAAWNEDGSVFCWLWDVCKKASAEKDVDVLKNILFDIDGGQNTILHRARRGHIFESIEALYKSGDIAKEEMIKLFRTKNDKGRTALMEILSPKHYSPKDSECVLNAMRRFMIKVLRDQAKGIWKMTDSEGNNVLGLIFIDIKRNFAHLEYDSVNVDALMRRIMDMAEECLTDSESLKELLCNSNNKGDTILHSLVDCGLVKHFPQVLSFARKVLNDDGKLEEFFTKRNSKKETFLQTALYKKQSSVVCEIWNIISDDMSRKRELLIQLVDGQHTVLHEAGSIDQMADLLAVLSEILDGEEMKYLLTYDHGETFFHAYISEGNVNYLRDIWKAFCIFFPKETLKQLLMQTDREGRSVLHAAILKNDVSIFEEVGSHLSDVLSREELERLMFLQDNDGNTIFHVACLRGRVDLLSALYDLVGEVPDEVYALRNAREESVEDIFQRRI